MVVVGTNEGSATGGKEGATSTIDRGGTDSCLFCQDLQDHRANSKELLPVLAGRPDWSPESTLTQDGRVMIIVPEQLPSRTKGKLEWWSGKEATFTEASTSMQGP
jgi:hypothetical protein